MAQQADWQLDIPFTGLSEGKDLALIAAFLPKGD